MSLTPSLSSFGVISTGSLRLDWALGIGGLPRGDFIELRGPTGSGKTTLCQHAIAEAQKNGGVCAFIDADHTLDAAYAARCGVDTANLYLSEPQDASQALQIAERLAASGALTLIVIDSLNTLVTPQELTTPLSSIQPAGKTGPAADASQSLLSSSLRRLAPLIARNGATLIFTGREQTHSSAVYHGLANNLERLAIKLHAALCLALEPRGEIHQAGQITGIHIQIRVIKSKFSHNLRVTNLDIMYNHGIDKISEIFDLGNELGLINKQKGFYTYQEQLLGRQRSQALEILDRSPSLAEQIEQVIRLQLH